VSHGDAALQRLADQTGGRFFLAQSSKDLEGRFAEIEQDLRTQLLCVVPAATSNARIPRVASGSAHSTKTEGPCPPGVLCPGAISVSGSACAAIGQPGRGRPNRTA
jgi:hypothetical protein